ncbi:hypothetical protein EEB13_14455 [Rhodococcus sp. WS3]|nr:hypothetical protein EEB13_14455 [Rhodococcus sp. WS3]
MELIFVPGVPVETSYQPSTTAGSSDMELSLISGTHVCVKTGAAPATPGSAVVIRAAVAKIAAHAPAVPKVLIPATLTYGLTIWSIQSKYQYNRIYRHDRTDKIFLWCHRAIIPQPIPTLGTSFRRDSKVTVHPSNRRAAIVLTQA